MSSVYVLEPPTKGKVVINTSMGPLDIELWPKEAPKAARNFVQLCLEGYYDNTSFHRIIKSFLVQGGDATGTGTGGESVFGGTFGDEFHSRIKFNHRGLVACANAGSPHSNGSQFFMTLDRCDWLYRKNTIFGKVTGDSIYNLLRLGDVETDKDDRPISPAPKILSVEVLWNPFDDIVPRQVPEKLVRPTEFDDGRTEKKQKAIKKLNVLSFGDEVEEDEREFENIKEKIKSIHDVLDDPLFLKAEPTEARVNSAEMERKKEMQRSVREALNSKRNDPNKEQKYDVSDSFGHTNDDDDDDDEVNFDARMRSQILKKRRVLGDIVSYEKLSTSSGSKSIKKDRVPSPSRKDKQDDDDDNNVERKAKVDKLFVKKRGIGSEARTEQMVLADSDLQLLSQAEKQRQIQKQKKRRNQGRDEYALAMMDKFQKSLSKKLSAPPTSSNKGEDADELGFLSNQLMLKFAPDEKDGMARKNDPNEYVVHDPLLEKGKEKFSRMQAKLKRREREWTGNSLT
ncbi:Peptidyl-prolyl cis-trans isomerase-like 2 [Platanthera guangdongensis]|uniref:Peptidyl-prolyl cis-trans isomerase-like 2 n=1 Tax=Platanthera guangdongensis TaxID=2320717 RepID=A0ABR2M3K6_9ASPA